MTTGSLDNTLRLIDEANAKDPNTIDDAGQFSPAELVYGRRMDKALEEFCASPSEHLRIAVRGQHIERWTSPRASFPEGRTGYLRWRSELKNFHARRTGDLMRESGYDDADIERVGSLIQKRRIKQDVEAQTLEDVACLVFLEHYAPAFIADHTDEKVIDILGKTARKMSDTAIAAAANLPLTDRLSTLLHHALSGPADNQSG